VSFLFLYPHTFLFASFFFSSARLPWDLFLLLEALSLLCFFIFFTDVPPLLFIGLSPPLSFRPFLFSRLRLRKTYLTFYMENWFSWFFPKIVLVGCHPSSCGYFICLKEIPWYLAVLLFLSPPPPFLSSFTLFHPFPPVYSFFLDPVSSLFQDLCPPHPFPVMWHPPCTFLINRTLNLWSSFFISLIVVPLLLICAY